MPPPQATSAPAFVGLAQAQHATTLRKGEVVSGPLAASQSVPVVISLKLRNQDQLTSFLANAQKPGTPVAQRTMSPEQFAAKFSPTQAQAQAVADYLTSAGFKNVAIAPNPLAGHRRLHRRYRACRLPHHV